MNNNKGPTFCSRTSDPFMFSTSEGCGLNAEPRGHAKKELPNLEKVTETFRRDRQVQIYTRVQIICCIRSPIQAKDEPLNGTFLDILLNARTDLLLVESEHPVI